MKGRDKMCLAIPGKVLQSDGNKSVIEMLGVKKEISTALLDNVKVGDYVLVHAGSAISKIDEDEALKTIELFEELRKISNE
jgi:hydrogenase expression/formation protein HypC